MFIACGPSRPLTAAMHKRLRGKLVRLVAPRQGSLASSEQFESLRIEPIEEDRPSRIRA